MPDAYVIDTDIMSYLFRGDSRADRYRPYVERGTGMVSFMTVAELELWARRHGWAESRRRRMAVELRRYTVVASTRRLCRIWAEVSDSARRNGRRIETADAWIAATAVSLDLPLLTNNRSDFAGVDGLVVLPDPGA